MPSIQGVFRNNNQVVQGATVSLFLASSFATPPAKNTTAPTGALQTVTSGAGFGCDGAFLFTGVLPGEYWVSCSFYGTTVWEYFDVTGSWFTTGPPPGDGQVLVYSAALSGWGAASGIVSLADGQFLTYSAGTASWVNSNPKYATVLTPVCAFTPSVTGVDTAEVPVVYSPVDGVTPLTFNVRRATVRVAVSGSTSGTINLEKYSGAVAFTPTLIGSVCLLPNSYTGVTTGGWAAGTLLSGDKVRVNFTGGLLATGASSYTIALELGT